MPNAAALSNDELDRRIAALSAGPENDPTQIDSGTPESNGPVDVGQLSDEELDNRIASLSGEPETANSGSLGIDLARSTLGQGLALGFGDEIEAFIRSKINGSDMDVELETVRGEIEGFRERSPGLAFGSELVGGLAVPGGAAASALRGGASLGSVIARGAAIGGATGGVAGFGAGEGDQRLQSAAVGAALGTGLGAVGTPAVLGAAKGAQLAKRALSRPGARQEAVERVATDLKDVNTVEVASRASESQATGVNPNLIEAVETVQPGASRGLVGSGRAAASIPGPGQLKASKILEDRQAAQSGELSGFIDDALGADDFETATRRLADELSENARIEYGQLHALPAVSIDGELKTVLKNPLVRKALPDARELALADGTTLKVPNVLKDEFIEAKTLDYLQRALRTKALGVPSTSTVAFGKLRQRVLPVIDKRVPGFKDVRTRYADGKAAQEALELGEKFSLRLGANQRKALAQFDKMDKPQQELFRLGVARVLKDRLGNAAGPGTNVARPLTTEGAQATLRRVLPREAAETLIEQSRVLSEQSSTRAGIGAGANQGSRTTPLAEEIAEGRENASLAANVLLGRPISALQNIASRTARGIDKQNAEQVIDILLEARPKELRALLNEVSKARVQIKQSQGRRGVVGIAATSAASEEAARLEGRRRAAR